MPVHLIRVWGSSLFFVLGALASLLGACARQRAEIFGASVDGAPGAPAASSAARGTVPRRMPPGAASRLDLLSGTAQEFGIDDQAIVWAVVVDIGSVAVAVVHDGTAILFLDANHPAAGHECHRVAAQQLCAAAAARLDMTAASRDLKQPSTGRVKFFFLTPHGPRIAEASIDELDGEQHPLRDVFLKAQHIFYEPRIVPEAPDARCPP